MTSTRLLFIGIKGSVIAIDRASGQEVWRSKLKGSDFVNVVLEDGELFAAAHGELFCLDAATGSIRWHNPLKGLGWGLVTIAGDQQNSVLQAKKRQEEAAAAASSTAAST
ncbi:MAG TPA: PQQ-binding-like beta-propeller repeat protein [Candidatus Saccharimonadales bacterium]|nr:PQQ-binding-like beta-propeller repeat protein [Candidatus Saccharimonadales bacterium]HVP11729.1 PQQ-binding-like beta-propeller repeat protein [Phycisphaerae bacterium]